MKWVNGVLRPYLRNRLKPLLEEPAAEAKLATVCSSQASRVVPSTNIQRMKVAAAASSAGSASKLKNRTATIGLGGLSAESLILQQQQSSVLASATTAALAAAKRRKAASARHEPPPPQTQQQQTAAEFYQFLSSQKLQAAAAAAQPQQPKPQQQKQQQAAAAPQQQPQDHPSSSSSSSTIKVEVNAPASSPPSRFKRCYYVPVMNPLPDLKEKQLAVLDMRLFGIRDMPTFKERSPSLPPSVLGTAKLRGLSLLQVPEMVAAMEEQGSAVFLSGADVVQAAFPLEEEEEEEDREEGREGRVADGKGF